MKEQTTNPDPSTPARSEAELQALADQAYDEALATGEPIAVDPDVAEYTGAVDTPPEEIEAQLE